MTGASRTRASSTVTAPTVSAVQSFQATDIETGETHSHVRTAPKARAVHTKPGMVGAFLATVAVLNPFGKL